MTPDDLLQILYRQEEPSLRTNDWPGLRVPVAALVTQSSPTPAAEVHRLLRELCLSGKSMLLPNWERWGADEDERDGSHLDSATQWEPTGGAQSGPRWVRRKVFWPDDPSSWFVRSRMAETARLLSINRERFRLGASTAHLGYEYQPRFRPRRDVDVKATVAHLIGLVRAGELGRASNRQALEFAIEVVGDGFARTHIAAFQARAWESILRSLFGRPRTIDATMITAGVSSGKTFAFLLPTLTLLLYRALTGNGGVNRALVIYPRTSLVEDQYRELSALLRQINDSMAANGRGGPSLTAVPALDAGQMLGESIGAKEGSLRTALEHMKNIGVEIILTTPESLKNRMLDPRAVSTYLSNVEIVVFDEIHLMEGIVGCHGIHFVRRLRQLVRELRRAPGFEPVWVGASATVAEPIQHAARVLTLEESRVEHVTPGTDELARFATFHHLFLHPRVGSPSISAVTNGVSCLVHTRNNSTAHSHYVDPSAPGPVPPPPTQIEKTIVFVDSLSTIGRLAFTTADNEGVYEAFSSTPPYYSWFYRPAARLRATAAEEKAMTKLGAVREWCAKCYHGIPDRIEASALQAKEFVYLRTKRNMKKQDEALSTPPGFEDDLQRLSGRVGNLDQCPFHRNRTCWWFSQDSGQQQPLAGKKVYVDQNRALPYTSKSEDRYGGLHRDVNDYFMTDARTLWKLAAKRDDVRLPDRSEAVSTLLASPRIEVGVDFKNVRDGATHKAMRSAASFQQKIGRIGREDQSDSLIVTFLAHRPTDAHFAHHPARLIDASHLDPIPLKSENPDILRGHMFSAGLELIASRSPGTIPNTGHELNIVGTGSDQVAEPWEGKVNGCIRYINANRAAVNQFMLAATKQKSSAAAVADETIDRLLELLELFVIDLSGAYVAGRTPAHWFKENQRPEPTPAFSSLVRDLTDVTDKLRKLSLGLPPSVEASASTLLAAAAADAPTKANLTSAANSLMLATATTAITSGLAPDIAGVLMGVVSQATQAATTIATLTLHAPLPKIKLAHEIIQAFFEENDQSERQRGQYYLHDILTSLLPFRRFYPFSLVRTHFQHMNARQVRVLRPDGRDDLESLSTSLYELLPGTWNYRWVAPYKSPAGPIDVMGGSGDHFINISEVQARTGAIFEPTSTELTPSELPDDIVVQPGTTVPILRPVRLSMSLSKNRPEARRDNGLVGDGDEFEPMEDENLKQRCPTLPRAFPATWCRVTPDPAARPIHGEVDPGAARPIPCVLPAIGRVLFSGVTFTSALEVARFVYAIDRTYGIAAIESPRIYYRAGSTRAPVVLGDRLGATDGLVFRLNRAALDAVVGGAISVPGALRGELTARALRRFIARTAHTRPFATEMVRKVVLMEHLDTGGTLPSLDAAAVRKSVAAITPRRYEAIATALRTGLYAGVEPAEAARGLQQQADWYTSAWDSMLSVQRDISGFTDAYVAEVAKDLLVHTLAVTILDGLSRLVGAGDGDVAYFHSSARDEIYIFDAVDGGNGCAETISRFLQIPPLRRILAARNGLSDSLPSSDGFMLIEETLSACPAQTATRLLFEASARGVSSVGELHFPRGLGADLEARVRHEYDPVVGACSIVVHVQRAFPAVFSGWTDLLWLQLVPERFGPALVNAGVCANTASFRSRAHLCTTGCLECVDSGDASIYGSLASREHVSRNLLDALRRHILAAEPDAFLVIPAGKPVGAALQANAGRPVTDGSGAPISVVVDENGSPQQVLLTQVLSTVSPELALTGSGPLLSPAAGGGWDVNIPFLAGYRDERPAP